MLIDVRPPLLLLGSNPAVVQFVHFNKSHRAIAAMGDALVLETPQNTE